MLKIKQSILHKNEKKMDLNEKYVITYYFMKFSLNLWVKVILSKNLGVKI
jgi:hypothetical protein